MTASQEPGHRCRCSGGVRDLLRNASADRPRVLAGVQAVSDAVRVWRLEFPQQSGSRHLWLGPYTSQWMTAAADELVCFMEAEHCVTRPHPADMELFAKHRQANDHLLCGCASEAALREWFGTYLAPLQVEGGHIAVYDVPRAAIVELSDQHIVFVQRRATLVERTGTPAVSTLVRSSAGSRTEIIASSNGKYAYRGSR